MRSHFEKESVLRAKRPSRELVERHLDTLAFMGELHADAEGRYHALRAAG
ncbi:MAG: hypothetical protein M3409_01720 [Gemmatimonadota bacterium]|jgi:hypothetical protein|nr:hypothetical protein [Gemmatimonadota bacterium]